MGHAHRLRHLVTSTLRRLAAPASTGAQDRHLVHLRFGSTVRGLTHLSFIHATKTNILCSNILVAVFRIISIVRVDFRGDMTDDLAAAMTWIYAQLSTAIILACCPLLRPVFEKMIPRRFTSIRRTTSLPNQKKFTTAPKIQKTTDILVYPNSTEVRSQPLGIIHEDAHIEPMGPKFEVERSQPISGRRTSCLF